MCAGANIFSTQIRGTKIAVNMTAIKMIGIASSGTRGLSVQHINHFSKYQVQLPGRCIKFVDKLSCNVCDFMDLQQNLSRALQHFQIRRNTQSNTIMNFTKAPQCRANIDALTAVISSALELNESWHFSKKS